MLLSYLIGIFFAHLPVNEPRLDIFASSFSLPRFGVWAVFMIGTLLSLAPAYALEQPAANGYTLTKLFPTAAQPSARFSASIMASPLLDESQGKALVIAPVSNGVIAALDSATGAVDWQIQAPTAAGQEAQLVATPLLLGDKLVIVYQCWEQGKRASHRMAVIDTVHKRLHPDFPVLELAAQQTTADGLAKVTFDPAHAFSHAALKYAPKPGADTGWVYAAFGNSADEQPYHGWLFEIDMHAWQHGNTAAHPAISSVLLITPESKCPVTQAYGNQEMICGGGIWTPAGLQVYAGTDGVELIVPTGNGQTDLKRHDYANSLLRVKPGLRFDAACDVKLCADFNPEHPTSACLASCQHLFIPRLGEHDAPLRPASGECDKKSFSECVAWMDYDLGGSAPVKTTLANGVSVLVQPSKDGSVYLLDAQHLGRQYDRLQIVELCGTKTDACKFGWMGMIVTQPVITQIDNQAVVVIPTFVPDQTHPAGLVALKVVLEQGQPKLKRFWQFPNPANPLSLQSFRSHPSLPSLALIDDTDGPTVWVVDIGMQGMLYGIRIKDGALLAKQALQGAGRQLSAPLIYRNNIYISSILPNTNQALIEAFHIGRTPTKP